MGDAHGLNVYVSKAGTRCWRQKYRYNGKEKILNHGTYPDVSLADARKARDKAIKELKQGLDPSKVKRRGKGQQKMTVDHVHVNEGGQAVIGNVVGATKK